MIRPTKEQQDEELYILQEIANTGVFEGYEEMQKGDTTTPAHHRILSQLLMFFYYCYTQRWGRYDIHVSAEELKRQRTSILTKEEMANVDLFMEIESKRTTLLGICLNPQFHIHIIDSHSKLNMYSKKFVNYTLFFLFIQYWLLSAKLYPDREITPGFYRFLKMLGITPQLRGSVQEQYDYSLELLEKADPQLYGKIQHVISNDDIMRKLGIEGELKQLIAPTIPIPGAEAPGIPLWQGINKVVTQPIQPGAKPLPPQESLALLETFFTTPKSMSQIARESNGQWSVAGIRKNLNTSLGRVWEVIPPQDRQGYETAQEAMQAVIASPIKTEETRRKMRENERPSWKIDKPRYHTKNARKKPGEEKRRTGSGRHKKAEGEQKTEFSATHTQHLSDAASERWRRHREEQAANTTT